MTRIKEVFTKIKQGHPYWKKGNPAYKKRLEKAFEPLFEELKGLGVQRAFAESLLFFGKEFVGSLESSGPHSAGGTVSKMINKEIREAELAEKHGARVWTSAEMKGDKVGIKVLLKKT